MYGVAEECGQGAIIHAVSLSTSQEMEAVIDYKDGKHFMVTWKDAPRACQASNDPNFCKVLIGESRFKDWGTGSWIDCDTTKG